MEPSPLDSDTVHNLQGFIVNTDMRTNIRISIILTVIVTMLGLYGCRLHRSQTSSIGFYNNPELYYERIGDNEDVNWEEEIPVFHHWREIPSEEFYFNVPSDEQQVEWRNLCEERNVMDSTSRRYVQGYYANMNQYVTVHDFYELWYHDDSYLLDDELTTWRLMQYDSLAVLSPDSEFDKFYYLRNEIQGLLLFEPQSQWEMKLLAGLEQDFQEYYDRLIVREAKKHSGSSLAAAIEEEQVAWLEYHVALDSAFRVIDGSPDGMVGSSWPMAICGIQCDDARMRALSLEDFYFALTDSLDYEIAHKRSAIGVYDIEKHSLVSAASVSNEYSRFKDFFKDHSFFDPEYSYPESELRSALDDEMRAWEKWMATRRKVSSLLDGLCKEVYDNSTNNVRRYKLIMLKNRYQGYGETSDSILKCLLPYTCKDSEIAGFSFEKQWREN